MSPCQWLDARSRFESLFFAFATAEVADMFGSQAKSGKNIKEVISADLQDVLIQFIMSLLLRFV